MAEEIENTPTEPVAPAPTEASSWAPSQEDWNKLQESNRQMAEKMGQYDQFFREPEPTYDEDLDLSDPYTMAALINQVVEQRLGELTPYVKSAAQDQGKRQMVEMFNTLEKEVGSFDHDLAERTAFYFFDKTGDAEGSVTEAAKYAANIRKTEREEGVAETRKRATRQGAGASEEVQGGGSAVPGEKPAQSYDEVIERWTHQTEV